VVDHEVVAGATDEVVGARTAVLEVEAAAPAHEVGAGPGAQVVLARAATDQVVAGQTADPVVAAESDDDVGSRGPVQDVAGGRADDGGGAAVTRRWDGLPGRCGCGEPRRTQAQDGDGDPRAVRGHGPSSIETFSR
jgi:hypothetical protein